MGTPAFVIRPFRPADAGQVARLFRETVHAVNARDYSPAQLDAWAPDTAGAAERWGAILGDGRASFVAVTGSSDDDIGDAEIIGFADVERDGHVDHLFVHHRHQRRGVGAALHDAVEAAARRCGADRLFTEASITARPFFLSRGYAQVRQQTVTIRGVDLTNFVMEKLLAR